MPIRKLKNHSHEHTRPHKNGPFVFLLLGIHLYLYKFYFEFSQNSQADKWQEVIKVKKKKLSEKILNEEILFIILLTERKAILSLFNLIINHLIAAPGSRAKRPKQQTLCKLPFSSKTLWIPLKFAFDLNVLHAVLGTNNNVIFLIVPNMLTIFNAIAQHTYTYIRINTDP